MEGVTGNLNGSKDTSMQYVQGKKSIMDFKFVNDSSWNNTTYVTGSQKYLLH